GLPAIGGPPDWFGNVSASPYFFDRAEEVFNDVGIVDRHVQPDRTGALHVSPGADDDAIVTTNSHLTHEEDIAEDAGINDSLCQPIRSATSVVLCGGKHDAGTLSSLHHLSRCAHGECQRLL